MTVLECITATCSLLDVPIDLTWVAQPPAIERVVDTVQDIHGSGVVSNQLGVTTPGTVSGSIDGIDMSLWTVSFVQINSGVQAGVGLTPTP